jgi:ATP-binding cassette, subfamily B, heavy metal transporter
MVNEKNKYNKRKIDFKHNLSEYWTLLKKYKSLLFGLVFVIFLIEAAHIVPKFLFKILVDEGTLFAAGNLGFAEFRFMLLALAGVYLSVNFIQIVSSWFRSYFLANLETKVMMDIKRKYFAHILGLDREFHSTNKTGSLISKLIRGSGAVERMTDVVAFNFAPLIFQLIVIGVSFAYFSIASAIVILVITLTFVLFSFFIQQAQQSARLYANKMADQEKANVSDVFTNIDSIKFFGKEKLINKRFKKLIEITRRADLKAWSYFRLMTVGQISIIVIGTILILYFPLISFLAGEVTLGTIVFIYTAYGTLMGPIWSFVHGMQGFYRSMADFEDLFEYGKRKNSIKDKGGSKALQIEKGQIEFKNVDFSYNRDRKIFEKLSLKIPANKTVAFVGHSGCGKSSLIKLLYRLYDLDKGEILVDGQNIKDVRQESLRSDMSIVPQECILFDDTIYNNIKFANPKATKKEVMGAIKFAQLDRVIEAFPEKENTIVGERGVKLSGGEKQRVSIARAILADKKVLVLDEATSALDSETEWQIQQDLEKLMKGRTSIIIAHRLSTIMKADMIVVMKDGRIEQKGTHRELITEGGEYARLWEFQKGGFVE